MTLYEIKKAKKDIYYTILLICGHYKNKTNKQKNREQDGYSQSLWDGELGEMLFKGTYFQLVDK